MCACVRACVCVQQPQIQLVFERGDIERQERERERERERFKNQNAPQLLDSVSSCCYSLSRVDILERRRNSFLFNKGSNEGSFRMALKRC